MKRKFGANIPVYTRDGFNDSRGRSFGWRAWSSLSRAVLGIRRETAEIEADGRKPPSEIVVRFRIEDKHGDYLDSEIVAIWKRGRFVWIDPYFKQAEKNNAPVSGTDHRYFYLARDGKVRRK